MQVTIAGRDVELPDGVTLGRCRRALARLTGADELVDAVLGVDGRVLADDHVTGVPPLVHGAVLEVGGGAPDPAALAAAAPWHVAVLAGPGAGLVAVPGRDGVVAIGRAADDGVGAVPAGVLALPDPAVSGHHALVRVARRAPGRWRVADVGSVNGTSVGGTTADPARPRAGRRAGRWGRLVRADAPVVVGRSVLVVRTGPAAPGRGAGGPASGRGGAGSSDEPSGRAARDDAARGDAASGGATSAARVPAAVVVPALVAVVLAAVTGSPVLLALGLAGPLAAVAPAVTARLRARRPAPTTLGADAAAAAVALAAAGRLPGGPDDDATSLPWWGWAVEGLAIVGPQRHAAARALVAAAAALRGAVSVPGTACPTPATPAPDWSWLRRPSGASRGRLRLGGPRPGAPHLTVLDPDATIPRASAAGGWSVVTGVAGRDGGAPDPDGPEAAAAGTGVPFAPVPSRGPDDAVLVLAASRRDAPAWCRWVLEVDERGSGRLHGPDGVRAVVVPLGSAEWAERQARRLAAAWAAAPPPPDDAAALPRAVGLADLLGLDDVTPAASPAAVAARWRTAFAERAPLRSLAVPLGVGGTGAAEAVVRVDLLADGPHALVAGTTGSGKSELLQSWLLGLALRHPPGHLAVVLVDYKGGASFGPCVALPHVVGLATDLDPTSATRALAGLRAELRRRKRLLAGAGVTDLEALRARGDAPPRLLVVVDEFRALAAELPDVVTGLVDLAAQGRSLGAHLVLATQRPSGAVTPQMRANLALRVCLRVPDAADSADVVEVADAAALPADAPGRAVVRRDGRTQVVQTAWAALPPGTWSSPPAAGGPVVARWADDRPVVARPSAERCGPARSPVPAARSGVPRHAGASRHEAPRTDHATALVELARGAADALGAPPPAPVWSPALPDVVPETLAPRPDGALVLGLVDRPEVPDHAPLRWWPGTGPLAVAGRPRSGRSTALAVVARAALARGDAVHVVGRAPVRIDHPGLGTVVTADDPARLARLLRLLLGGSHETRTAQATRAMTGPVIDAVSDLARGGDAAHRPRTLLVLDDVGAVQRALERLPRGAGADLVERVLREGPRRGVDVVLAGAPGDLGRLVAHCAARLVLPAEHHDDVLLGVPPSLAAARAVPGRGALVGPDGVALCQVARPGDGDVPAPRRTPPPRLRAVPDHVPALPDDAAPSDDAALSDDAARSDHAAPADDAARRAARLQLPVGLGGDDAGPVLLDVTRGALVVGPPGSGRSTALRALAAAAARRGVAVLRPDDAASLAAARTTVVRTTAGAGGALGASGAPGTGTACSTLVLVDDADEARPDLDEALAALVTGGPGGTPGTAVVVAARTERAVAAYRGVLAALRGAPTLVLCPAAPGSAELVGADLALVVDPDRPRAPGRGAVVHRGVATPVQVADVRSGAPGPAG